MPPGIQPPLKLIEGKPTTDRMVKRPRLLVYVEPSIHHEMHNLAHKTGRSVSNLSEYALARLLADIETGQLVFDQDGNARRTAKDNA